jgi:choline monooxygenase
MTLKKQDTWEIGAPEETGTLPSRYFYAPDVYRRELEEIFYKTWQCVCHGSELAEAGAYVKFDIADQSVLVVRGDDGEVHAFHNVCQHRGTRLVEEERGQFKRMIICPYHSWAYRFDGALRNAPRSEELSGFDPTDYGLKPVKVEAFAGFFFINLDPAAAPLAADVTGALETMRRFLPDLDDIELVNVCDFEVDANWKVIIDNAIEGYHFKLSGPVHKDLAALIDFDGYELTAHDKWWTFIGPPRAVETAFGHPVAGEAYQTDWFFNIQLWPATVFYAFPYADVIGTFHQVPLGPERTLLRCSHYRPKGRPESALSKAVIAWFNEQLAPEDIDLNLAVQRGLKSFGFDKGLYLIDAKRGPNSEHLVHHFHSLVYRAIGRTPVATAAE